MGKWKKKKLWVFVCMTFWWGSIYLQQLFCRTSYERDFCFIYGNRKKERKKDKLIKMVNLFDSIVWFVCSIFLV